MLSLLLHVCRIGNYCTLIMHQGLNAQSDLQKTYLEFLTTVVCPLKFAWSNSKGNIFFLGGGGLCVQALLHLLALSLFCFFFSFFLLACKSCSFNSAHGSYSCCCCGARWGKLHLADSILFHISSPFTPRGSTTIYLTLIILRHLLFSTITQR